MFALLFGRVFCAAVCPLGAIQDAMVLFPVKLPRSVTQVLAVVPYIFLGLVILFAATGTAFLICQLDPFVPIFRLSGQEPILVAGIILLLAGIFVARPYCRFFCPFSVLLSWMSRLSRWHSSITPDECVKCRLCENSCPFDAIRISNDNEPSEPRGVGVRRLKLLLCLLPVLVGIFGWAGSGMHVSLSRANSTVRLAEAIQRHESVKPAVMTREEEAFYGSGEKKEDLYARAASVQKRFKTGGWFFGGFAGAVLGFSLIGVSIRRKRDSYEPDRGECLSCARCYVSCPNEHQRLKKTGAAGPAEAGGRDGAS
jgi:ferredoxin